MHILISDSDIEHRTRLIKFMEKNKHKVTEALTMDEVFSVCKTKCPDLLLIDSKLPGGSGAELVKQIRQFGGLASWNPIILMSDKIKKEDVESSLKAGADDFLIKPIDLHKLQFKINAAARLESLKDDVFSIAHNLVVSSHAALEVRSAQDNMTGVLDAQAFHQHLEKEWYLAKEKNKELFIMLINLDNFKEFNDIYGVEAGDRCIKDVAIVLAKVAPDKDSYLARTLGDNFGLLLPKSDYKNSGKIANNILKAVNSLDIKHDGSHHCDHVTVSIGIAKTNFDEQKNPLELLEAADYALYKAKHKGRNRVFIEGKSVKSEN